MENEKTHSEPEPESGNGGPKRTETKSRHWRHWHRIRAWYGTHKKLAIPATVLAVLLVLAVIPFTRYAVTGLFLKKDVTIEVSDSTTNTPVSGALVSIGSTNAATGANGKATLKAVKVGNKNVLVTKKYYKDSSQTVLVPILKQKSVPDIAFVATGRQALIKVTNIITGKVLANVTIKVADTISKTAANGTATVVVPAKSSTEQATLSLDGYNNATVTVKVSDQKIEENDYKLTPTGSIYFLSKLSGTIDVVKINLDGSDRKTVVAGTGNEDDQNTVLLASKDWKYLALLSRRAGSFSSLYLINTANDQMSSIDEGGVSFSLVGWNGSTFIYTVTRNDVQNWQPHRQALKSFNADTKQLLTLDQTGGQGTDTYNYAQESYGSIYLIQNTIVYDKTWNNYYAFLNGDPVTGKLLAGIYSINPDGSNHQTLKTFNNTLGWYTGIDSIPYQANEIYYQANDAYQQSLGKNGTSYYVYEDSKLTGKDDLTNEFNTYNQASSTYLFSPNNNQTFWAEPRDGKNTLFVGDQDGLNGKQVATLSDYNPYGWYTDDYLLVQKNNSELYIMAKDGSQPPVKISDYHKPAQTFYGYGGGYGGL